MIEMYSYKKQINSGFEDALVKVKEELKKEGFGVLTEIDAKETLKKKLNVDLPNYIILGACNPPFAHKALEVEQEVGLMLPCNVILFEDKEKVFVSTILPTVAMGMIDNPELKAIAEQVEEKLKRVIDNSCS